MRNIVVWDLDGTLACGKHRLHLLPTKDYDKTESWTEFNKACADDKPIQDNIDLLNRMEEMGMFVVILTGRSDIAEEETVKWLADNGVFYDALLMRSQQDNRPDIEVKEDALRLLGLDDILCCFDDLEHVAKHIRSLGVTCHLVTHYDDKHAHTKSQEENVNE